jgi:peptidoglycan/xylan/chitin deacetylase (PgdA/CDA1 family)
VLALAAVLAALAVVAFGWSRLATPRSSVPATQPAPPPQVAVRPPAPPKPAPAAPMQLRIQHVTAKPVAGFYGTRYGIPILMFHRFELQPRTPFALSPAVFTQMLVALQQGGYCAITLSEYRANSFPLDCAGRKPVALTFDDSHPSQIVLRADGSLDPNSALGALRAAWPEARAMFFANVHNGGHPFGRDSAKKIALLERLGFEIGNHTVSHARLDKISPERINSEITGVCQYFNRSSMIFAYPYGVIPLKPLPTNLPGCAITAAFGADSGYFEGGYTPKAGRSLLAPLPGSADFERLRLRIPRLNISSMDDLKRDVLENPDVYTLPAQDLARAR